MSPELLPSSMLGLGQCEPHAPCEYHGKKVAPVFTGMAEVGLISEFPPSSVWGKEHIYSISALTNTVKQSPEYAKKFTIDKLKAVHGVVNAYWAHHTNDLDGPSYNAWDVWQKQAKEKGKYAAGGWAASPQQISQYVETVKVLKENGLDVSKVLRLGTASGVHTQQEVFALIVAGEKHPKMTIVDLCAPPLVESMAVSPEHVQSVSVASVLSLPPEWKNAWPLITTHFLEAFLPTAEQYTNEKLDHNQSLKLKEDHLSQVYKALSPGGFFLAAIGTSSAPQRFQSASEIQHTLQKAGFAKDCVFVVPTADHYDYSSGKHTPGNYIVIAQKESV